MKRQLKKDLKVDLVIISICFLLCMSLSIGYSILSTTLNIKTKVVVEGYKDIMISKVSLPLLNNSYELNNTSYSPTTITANIGLSNIDSTVTYNVTLINNSSIVKQLKKINFTTSNSNISYKIEGLNQYEAIYVGDVITFSITFYYNNKVLSNKEGNMLLEFIFEPYQAKQYFVDIIKEKVDNETLFKENDIYYYRGYKVNNYLLFNDELWQIIRLNSDNTLTISLSDVIKGPLLNPDDFWGNMNNSLKMGKALFDPKGIRYQKNSYCKFNNKGCNAFSIGLYNGLEVTKDSKLKEYLDLYYNSIIDKKNIIKYNYKVGLVGGKRDYEGVKTSENVTIMNSYISLLSISDYMHASIEQECSKSFLSSRCSSNWLNISKQYWFSNGKINTEATWITSILGTVISDNTFNYYYIKPVLTLNSDIIFDSGEGTQTNPYVIK